MGWFSKNKACKGDPDSSKTEDLVLLLIEMLSVQRAMTPNFKLEGPFTAPRAAVGYIFGFVDAGFQLAKLDMPKELKRFMFLSVFEALCPGEGELYLRSVADRFSDPDVQRGVMRGGEDYFKWANSSGKAIPLGWCDCF